MQPNFIVSTAKKAIVLNPADPVSLCNLLPMARPFEYQGNTLYAVPHDIDVVRLLRNVGVDVPSPSSNQYTWPGRFEPFPPQRDTVDFLTTHPRAFVLSGMGTGKTLSTLWSFDYLRSVGKCHRMLVAAPLSALERAWGDSIFTDFPHLKFAVLHGTAAKRRKLLAVPHDIYIINHDGVGVVLEELVNREDIDLVVIDELAVYRNSQSQKFKMMKKVCTPERWVWGLTGSPIPNLPTDAWAQVALVNPTNAPRTFAQFRGMTMYKVGPWNWVSKPDALDKVYQIMQPAVRYTLDDLGIDLAEPVFQSRSLELSKQQQDAYDTIRAGIRLEMEGSTVLAINEADRLMKLVQVACGVLYSPDGETLLLDNEDRVKEIFDIVEQADGKVIVFVPFTGALHALRDALAERYPTELVYGGTSKTDRDQAFWRFQHAPKEESTVLVANARTMAHALTLTEAEVVVWFAPTTSHETFDQANHRIIRPSQKRTPLIVMLESTPTERKIYARLKQRQTVQGLLLETVRDASAPGRYNSEASN